MEPRGARSVLPCMRAFLIVLGLLALPHAAPAQSWCGTPGLTATETTICNDLILSRLDRRLTELYTAGGAGYAGISLSQREWLDRRDACGRDVVCIEMAYRDRIRRLEPKDGARGRGELPMAQIPNYGADEPPAASAGNAPDPGTGLLRPWCDGTLNATEEVICRTPRLADMDAALGAVYGAAKAADDDRAQMSWLRQERDDCGTDAQCIGLAYLERIVELGARIRRQ